MDIRRQDIRCRTCKFWDPLLPVQRDDQLTGLCRENSPRVAGGASGRVEGEGMWPITDMTDWCGRHEGRGRRGGAIMDAANANDLVEP